MKLVWKNNVYICTTKHKDGYSEVRGFNREDVLMAAIARAFEDQ